MQRRFLVLDSCRGLCAVAVVLFHLDARTHFYDWPIIRNSWVAVDFFFTLSGFVIASAYAEKLTSLFEAGRFTLRRIGRLYPLHAAVLAAYVAIELYKLWALQTADAFADNTSRRALFEQVFLVQGFTANHESWNYPAWSISVELWINVIFAALLVSFRRRFALCMSVMLISLGALVQGGHSWTTRFEPAQAAALKDASHAAFEFLLGFVAFKLFEEWQRPGRSLARHAELFVLPLAVAAFCFVDRLPNLGPSLIFFCIVLILAFEAGPLSMILRWPPLTKLGAYSYSIYLTHSLYLLGLTSVVAILGQWSGLPAIIEYNGDDLLILGGPWVMDGAALLLVAFTIAGSIVTYRLIEEPGRTFFNGMARSHAISKGAADLQVVP